MTEVTPYVDLTIFPRINYFKTFNTRAIYRDINGRIFGQYGFPPIDHLPLFPEVDGSTCLSQETFLLDLLDGGNITDVPTSVIDLRNDCGTASVIDINQSLPTGAVTITGTVQDKQTIRADTSDIGDLDGLGAFSYQWSANNVAISGATDFNYMLTQAEVGKTITVTVSYTDGSGNFESLTSSATTAVTNYNDPAVGDVTISGTTEQGQTLTATHNLTDDDGTSTFNYLWILDGTNTTNTTTSYLLTANEVGKQLVCQVSYTDNFGNIHEEVSAPTATIVGANNLPTGYVVITGDTFYGETLTADTSNIADADVAGTISFSYQWSADGTAISGATGSTYDLTLNEIGKAITVTVTYTDDLGTVESLNSDATVDVTPITTTNLKIHLDAGNSSSYSGSGNAWNDLTSSNEDFTLYNTPTYSTNNGGELQFSGSNDYARINGSTEIGAANEYGTIQFWFRSISGALGQNSGSWARLVSIADNAGTGADTAGGAQGTANDTNAFIGIIKQGNDDRRLGIYYKGAPGALNNSTDVNTDNYFNLAFTWAKSGSDMNFVAYLNGSAIKTVTESGLTAYSDTATSITIGEAGKASLDSSHRNASCAYTTFLLYDVALTATQVLSNYNATKARHGH